MSFDYGIKPTDMRVQLADPSSLEQLSLSDRLINEMTGAPIKANTWWGIVNLTPKTEDTFTVNLDTPIPFCSPDLLLLMSNVTVHSVNKHNLLALITPVVGKNIVDMCVTKYGEYHSAGKVEIDLEYY